MTEFNGLLSTRIGDDAINAKERLTLIEPKAPPSTLRSRDAAAERRAEVAKELADMKRLWLARKFYKKTYDKTKFFGTGRIL